MPIVINGNGTVTGISAQASDIELTDSTKIMLGTGDDLQLYHDGSNSYIDEAGTGGLKINANNSLVIGKYGGAESMAVFDTDGAVTLYHDNSAKIATTATGIDVTGTVTADGGLIQTGSSGGTAHSTADDFVVEGSGHTGITILGGNSESSRLHFGDSGSNEAGLVIYNHSTDLLELGTAGTPRVQLDSSGNLKVTTGNLVIGTAGKGIDFSAATDLAGMTSELLDDYEEGTWTPNEGAGLTVVGTFTSSGYYTKIGRLVHIEGRVGGTTSVAMSTTDQDISSNNPFTPTGSLRASGLAINQTIGASAGLSVIPGTGRLITAETMAATTNIYFSATYSI